jgi:hypothetical protein
VVEIKTQDVWLKNERSQQMAKRNKRECQVTTKQQHNDANCPKQRRARNDGERKAERKHDHKMVDG